MMGDTIEIGKSTDLADGSMKQIIVKGRKILLARVGDSFYAADNICPHMGAKLSEGKLEGTIVTCPRHSSQFDLADGHVVRWTNLPALVSAISKVIKSPRSLNMYPVKLEDDRILLEL
jgi:3-phenylpropionate/trans-cinnamate dioxygenase ferredoxin subunit